jgi:hypothetical protein
MLSVCACLFTSAYTLNSSRDQCIYAFASIRLEQSTGIIGQRKLLLVRKSSTMIIFSPTIPRTALLGTLPTRQPAAPSHRISTVARAAAALPHGHPTASP